MKGIDFTPDMHRAIREGRKCMTRRVIKPQPVRCPHNPFYLDWKDGTFSKDEAFIKAAAKYKVGERVFVREAWTYIPLDMQCLSYRIGYKDGTNKDLIAPPAAVGDGCRITLAHEFRDYDHGRYGEWRSTYHMPECASRTVLDITGVRVERVNEISERDACDEGTGEMLAEREHWDGDPDAYRKCFRELWESIHGQGAWIRNDWVFVYEFKVVSE